MGATPKVYVICDNNCKYEGLTKEQILTAIAQAVEKGTITDVDTGFITTVKTINGTGLKFFVGEQHEYEALTDEQKQGLFAIITNDTTREGLLNAIASLEERAQALENWREMVADGGDAVEKAHNIDFSNRPKGTLYSVDGVDGLEIELEKNSIYLISSYGSTSILCVGTKELEQSYFSTIRCFTEAQLERFVYKVKDGAYRLFVEIMVANTDNRKFGTSSQGAYVYIFKIGSLPPKVLENPLINQ